MVEAEGWSPLPPTSLAYAAFDAIGLAGFYALQLRPHVEPLWVREDMRGTGLAATLVDVMSKFLEATNTRGFIVIADTPEAVKLCEHYGMRRVIAPVFIR